VTVGQGGIAQGGRAGAPVEALTAVSLRIGQVDDGQRALSGGQRDRDRRYQRAELLRGGEHQQEVAVEGDELARAQVWPSTAAKLP